MKSVFIYCLKDPNTGDVRYIGRTNNLKKRLKDHLRLSSKKKNHLGCWLKGLASRQETPILVVLHKVTRDESWEEEERRYISCARALRMDLVNTTDGGEGASGYRHSSSHCEAMRLLRTGVPNSPETRARISAAMIGVSKSPEHCAAMSAATKGMPKGPPSLKHRAALSAAKKGVPHGPHSPEHCANISKAINAHLKENPKGPHSPESCAKISAAKTGVPWSEARRAAYESRYRQ